MTDYSKIWDDRENFNTKKHRYMVMLAWLTLHQGLLHVKRSIRVNEDLLKKCVHLAKKEPKKQNPVIKFVFDKIYGKLPVEIEKLEKKIHKENSQFIEAKKDIEIHLGFANDIIKMCKYDRSEFNDLLETGNCAFCNYNSKEPSILFNHLLKNHYKSI